MTNWRDSINQAVSSGKTDNQFAIPDGSWEGDLFFITDSQNNILHAFVWRAGPDARWWPECSTWIVQP